MKRIIIEAVSQYANSGSAKEQNLAYALTGKMCKHDNVPFDKGSDIPEFHMSVKSSRFTLVSGKLMSADSFEGQIDEYFARVASSSWAYVTENNEAYIMDMAEFRSMLMMFARFERDSSKNGGKSKVRFPAENKKILAWLSAQVA